MLVCAASFTVRAYSSDRMPFSIVSRAPSPSAEERSIVKIRHEGFIHLTRRTLIYGAMKQRSSITAKLPLAPHVFSLIEQQSTLCLDSLLRVFILSLPRLFLSLSLSASSSLSFSFFSFLSLFSLLSRHRLKCPLLFLVSSHRLLPPHFSQACV